MNDDYACICESIRKLQHIYDRCLETAPNIYDFYPDVAAYNRARDQWREYYNCIHAAIQKKYAIKARLETSREGVGV